MFRGKWLQYVEQSMLQAVARAGAVPLILPGGLAAAGGGDPSLEALEICHGLLLTGGQDLAPSSYGERELRPEWAGDPERDAYELGLLAQARQLGLPVLGVCRGCQLLAVGSGGRLYQDIQEQLPGALLHRSQELYDRLEHGIERVPGTGLAQIFGEELRGEVNSVHHQAIRDPGELRVAARAPDAVIEAVENTGDRFELGVQWHPEWWSKGPEPVFAAFVAAAKERALAG
ncbi:MAG: peptidase C26 [Planctomycetota bacterium]|nr:MAG: peptidase C26 [Planctomycetota bacterium]